MSILVFGKIEGIAELNRDLEVYIRETGADAGREARITGRNLAVALAKATFPKGDSKAAATAGTAAVAKDIRKVYTTAGAVYKKLEDIDQAQATAMWSAYKGRRFAQVRRIIQDSVFNDLEVAARVNPAHHQKARGGNRRRVKSDRPRQLVLNPKARASYIKKRQRKVGLAKSGWGWAAKDLGGIRGIPPWARPPRHKLRLGEGSKDRTRGGFGVVIENFAAHGRENLPFAAEKGATRSAAAKLRKRLRFAAEANAAKFNRK